MVLLLSNAVHHQTITASNMVSALQQHNKLTRRPRSNSADSALRSLSDESSSSSSTSSSNSPPTKQSKNKKKRQNKTQRKIAKKSSATAASTLTLQTLTQNVSLEEQAKYVAIDCEMVGVGYNGNKSAVARVTCVGWDGQLLLDEFIRPGQQVVDYRSHVSGIVPSDLEDALDLYTVQKQVLALLQDKVLVGHGLKNDLTVLGISHPWYMTRDTAKYEPFMKVRFNNGILWPRKLKDLCNEKLQRDIQVPDRPHCPIEDAIAALDLYKVVRGKWEKVMSYKLAKTRQIESERLTKAQ